MTPKTMLLVANVAINQKSYENAQQVLEKILKYKISDDTIRNVVNFIGKLVYEEGLKINKILLKEKYDLLNNNYSKSDEIFYIETDGNFVHLLNKGTTGSTWHENKIGLVFSTDNIETRSNQQGEIYRIINKKEYISYFCPVEEFKKYLYCLALKNQYYKFKTCILISDGATWIKKFKKEYLPESIHILDYYHLVENTGKFAKFIYKSNELFAKETADRWCKLLRNSQYDQVLKELENFKDIKVSEGSVNLYSYIINNIDSINYRDYEEKRYIIGSGGIEGANKYVIQSRMKLSGMRWRSDTSMYVSSRTYCDFNELTENN